MFCRDRFHRLDRLVLILLASINILPFYTSLAESLIISIYSLFVGSIVDIFVLEQGCTAISTMYVWWQDVLVCNHSCCKIIHVVTIIAFDILTEIVDYMKWIHSIPSFHVVSYLNNLSCFLLILYSLSGLHATTEIIICITATHTPGMTISDCSVNPILKL